MCVTCMMCVLQAWTVKCRLHAIFSVWYRDTDTFRVRVRVRILPRACHMFIKLMGLAQGESFSMYGQAHMCSPGKGKPDKNS
jgi:hypothetical protein